MSVDLKAYFARIGYHGRPELTVGTLATLQRLHCAAIPFEAIDVLLDRGVDLEPAAVDDKLLRRRRGGYCFEQNSLFARVLTSLGFAVEPLLARVRWMAPADAPPPPATHMTLRVTADEQVWLVDVGFGSAVPTAPLRLAEAAAQETGHERYRLVPEDHGHRLQAHLEQRWETLYEVLPERRATADFDVANWYTATHPSSHFRHTLTVALSTPEARFALRDSRLTIRHRDGSSTRRFLDADGLETALADLFRLPVEAAWRPMLREIGAREPLSQTG